jgi:hypothetical protein
MRLAILALLLALIVGTTQAYPLQGGNENVKAVLFGAVRTSLGDVNATEEVLRLDVGLLGAENASYELVDQKNIGFQPSLYLALQPGRQISNQMVLFIVPKDDLFKLINVTPDSGKPFSVNWWATPKNTKQDLIIRFYGITDWITDPNQQGLVIQLRLGNNGSSSLPVSPENFTLLDQWGRDYYPVAGFEPMVIAPGMATGRVQIGFTGLSPLSRPAALAFDGQKIIDLETDMAPLSDAVVYGANATSSSGTKSLAPVQSATQPSASTAEGINATPAKMGSLKDDINASKERLTNVGGSLSAGQKSAPGSSLNASIDESRQRLDAVRIKLKQQGKNKDDL